MAANDKVILVDEQDRPVGEAQKAWVHLHGILHRAFSVFIFSEISQGSQLLLQQRQHDKYHGGGLWTNTCCSHPRPGERVHTAATRRLQEEMGFCENLVPVGHFCYRAQVSDNMVEHELDHVFIGRTSQVHFSVNPLEVSAYRWVCPVELLTAIESEPALYTPWLPMALKLALEGLDKGLL